MHQSDALKVCDLIMKGGITSGVVYPGAVVELARHYRFRCIGGSSAGAIAAAGTAAAELGRAQGGFEKLEEMSKELARPGFLLGLFRPTATTGPLMDLALDFLASSRKPGFRAAGWAHSRIVQPYLTWALLAAVMVLGPIAFWLGIAMEQSGWSLYWRTVAIMGAGGALLAVCLGLGVLLMLRHVQGLEKNLRDQHFGLCPGSGGEGEQQPALVDYLHRRFNHLAGRDPKGPPLTFRDLAESPAKVELCLISSNISLQRGYRFPLKEEEVFLYREEELRQFFPEEVLRVLRDAPAPEGLEDVEAAGFHFLPRGLDLPVIVAVRASLSFPILFSALPLYTLNQAFVNRRDKNPCHRIKESDLQRNYFSDGGIVSNFPIHLFDRWLPDCPTFGINLAALPEKAVRREHMEPEYLSRPRVKTQRGKPQEEPDLQAVHLPEADDKKEVGFEWHPVENLLDLVAAVFYTASNHRDILQAKLPSYRERIVTIRLGKGEGGLNLDMLPEVMQRLDRLGRQAGSLLARRFLEEGRFTRHWWVRFLVVTSQLERELTLMRRALENVDLHAVLDQVQDDFPFPRDPAWRVESAGMLKRFLELIDTLFPEGAGHFDDGKAPQPEPVKRLVPEE